MVKLKIAVIGPIKSGKTTISNILSEATEISIEDYRPTQGVRILEFEVPNIEIDKKIITAEIELYDCSGDTKFSTCWPAIAKDMTGIILVFDPNESVEENLTLWYEYFINQQGLADVQCLIFENSKNQNKRKNTTFNGPLANINLTKTGVTKELIESMKEEFNNFVSTIVNELNDKRDRQELTILNG